MGVNWFVLNGNWSKWSVNSAIRVLIEELREGSESMQSTNGIVICDIDIACFGNG